MKFSKALMLQSVVAGMFAISFNAYAAPEDIAGRKIVDIGCHNFNNTCFVSLDGAAFGGAVACPIGMTNELRFDNGDTTIGKRTFAALLAAYLAGKTISLHMSTCSSQGFPTIDWFHISN